MSDESGGRAFITCHSSLIVWWVTCLIWSTVWLFIKIGVTAIPPISFAGIRLLFAVACCSRWS